MSSVTSPKVLLMAGGTGGHVFPALALARVLEERSVSVEWLGTASGIEARLVPDAGIQLHVIQVKGLRGKGLTKLMSAPFVLSKAVWQARAILRAFNPDVVVGFGGFASGPGGLAAFLLRKPLLIHEQNAVAGTTNRLLSRLARKVFTAFPDVFPGAQQVGNPVREEIAAIPKQSKDRGGDRNFRLLVLGGSLGALAINEMLPATMALLSKTASVDVWHQTGKAHEQTTRDAYEREDIEANVCAFISDMSAAYAWADLVVCRSGALTVAELAAAGRPSILIPFPHAIDDHQTKNAEWLVNNGAAELQAQGSMKAEKLQQMIENLIADRQKLTSMSERALLLAMPDAANQLADSCMEVING